MFMPSAHPKAGSSAFLALSCFGSLMSSAALAAAPGPEAPINDAEQHASIIVDGQRIEEGQLTGEKATQPLQDTPQTVTVVSDQTIRKQNLLTLRDVLATVPGITFGAGEGGGGYGDSINLRGYSANNDITLDGVRDSAQYSRTDPFNTQQIEVYNGANSVFNGSGSVGGTINMVTKAPQGHDLTIIEGGIGNDNYYRGAVDSNWRFNDTIAFRLNAVYHENGVVDRDVEKYKRWGVAPALTIGVDSPTSLTLAYVHQKDDNTPIYGVPYFKNEVLGGLLPGIDRSDYYGIVNLDEQKTVLDRLTATFRHQFSDDVSVTNLTRYQWVRQYSQTSAPQGTFCLADGLQPVTTAPGVTTRAACPNTLTAGQYLPSGPRGLVRDQQNDLFYNQMTLRFTHGQEGGTRNILVAGWAYTREDYFIETASLPRNPDGTAVALPILPLTHPDTTYSGPINYTVTTRNKGSSTNIAGFLFDTIEFGPHFELNGGLRYERNKAVFQAIPVSTPGATALTDLQLRAQQSSETLFSYRIGAVYKPVESISLYAAYGNARTPSSATVRLGCGTLASNTAANPCAVAPETAKNYEIGVKANVMDNHLLLTAALFRNERSNYRVSSNDPSLPASLQVLDGHSRVDGVALGATGNITPRWTIFANYTYLNSKIVQGVSDFCRANPSVACANANAAGTVVIADPLAGDELVQTPKHSGSLFTSYKLPSGLELGYGLTYQGSFALNQRTFLGRRQFRSDDYITQRLFVSYAFANGLTAQLNVQNLFNEKYFTGIRNNINATTGIISGGWATPGEGRAVRASLFYSF
ncbi:MAG: TonB-dependent receptor [Sphingobium sp.]|nr:TonB-dependent receptor [Sphingobium sp.]